MSKENKFNPGQYTQAGRLTPDEDARQRKKQETGTSNKPSSEEGGPKAQPDPKQEEK